MLVTYFGKAANQKLAALVKNNSTKGVLLRTFWNYITATSAKQLLLLLVTGLDKLLLGTVGHAKPLRPSQFLGILLF